MKIENAPLSLESITPSLGREDSGNKGDAFKDVLGATLKNVNDSLMGAEKITQDFVLGKDVELHQVIIAGEQASLALQMTVQIRNKVIEAYQEIMRMQV